MKILSFALLTALSISSACFAEKGLPAYYPEAFENIDVIQATESNSRKLQIKGVYYDVWSNVNVHSLHTEHSSLREIKSGDTIGYRMQSFGERLLIVEIWKLPDDMAPPLI